MSASAEVLSSPDTWKIALPLFGAVIAWFTNEWRKRVADQYQRKEASYKEMLGSLRGFYDGTENAQNLRAPFLNQLNIAWLYCSDELIRKGYALLETVYSKKQHSDEEKENAMGSFVAAIRRDLRSRKRFDRTALTAADFRHLHAR